MPTLQIQKITKDYPGRRVLRGIELTLESGAIALLGPNGAGKSTLLGILSTRLLPTSGDFRLDDLHHQEQAQDLRQKIGVIGHHSYLYRDLSLEDNLMLFARLYNVSDPTTRIREIAEEFRLTQRLDQPIGQLSRGLLQRATLARATLHQPDLLLLDEPFTGLDPTSSDILEALIHQWRERKRLLLFATHDLPRATQCADRFLILAQGRIVRDISSPLTPTELRQHYQEATSDNL